MLEQNWKFVNNNKFIVYIFCLFIITNDIFSRTSVWYKPNLGLIKYPLYEFDLSILYIPIIIYGTWIIITEKKYSLSVWIVISYIIVQNIYFVFTDNFMYEYSSFELILTFGIGFLTYICVQKNKGVSTLENIFDFFSISHIILMLVGFFLSINLVGGGRYNAPNLDVNSSGMIFGMYFIYLASKNYKRNKIKIVIAFIALILTGARIPLLLSISFYFIIKANRIIRIKKYSVRKIINVIVSFLLIVLAFLFLYMTSKEIFIQNYAVIRFNETVGSFFTDGLSFIVNDDSGMGRIRSIQTGISLLGDNILGIGLSAFKLQYMMQCLGYPTFPHSTILTYTIILGIPIMLCFLYLLIKNIGILFFNNDQFCFAALYLIIFSIVGGGLDLNFKVIFFYFLVYDITRKRAKRYKVNKSKLNNCKWKERFMN